jgi:hypothetical protein
MISYDHCEVWRIGIASFQELKPEDADVQGQEQNPQRFRTHPILS